MNHSSAQPHDSRGLDRKNGALPARTQVRRRLARTSARCALWLLAFTAATACRHAANEGSAPLPSPRSLPPPTAAATAAPSAWETFVDAYIEAYFVAHPVFAVMQGRHEFDGRLPDWSRTGIQHDIAWLEASRVKALGFADDALSAQQRFQRAYLVSRIDNDLFWLREAKQPFTNPAFYFDSGLDPATYVNLHYAPVEKRARAFIRYASAVPNALRQIRANLQTPMPKTFVEYGVLGFNGFADFFRNDVPRAFADVKDPALQTELKSAEEHAALAMIELATWLESQRAQASDAFALGPQLFAAMLRMTEGVTTPLPELTAIGQADLEHNLSALKRACETYLPKGTLPACIAKQAADKPQGGVVDGARSQLSRLRQYIVDHDIVSIPGDETVQVAEAPAYRRQNFAYIDIPGPYEIKLPSTYYIAPPDPHWSPAEQAAYLPGQADLMFTSVHEVWPGHFLQFLHSNRSSWRFGQLFVGYAFAEGWAHYSEALMIEEGLATGAPELEIGQLVNALLRNVRFLCAIDMHTQGVTVERCERMFKEQAYQDPGNARQQASRGTYDPGYLNYTLGKLMIRKLRADWQAENPGAPVRQFHDAFLSFGGPPIPLLRDQLLKQPARSLF